MKNIAFPLKEISIYELYSGEKVTYEVPIYQRNYAWGKDEITTLVQDVYDAFSISKIKTYFIGTLVTHNKGDQVLEVIDGQQRLTTINIILNALNIKPSNKLTYRARKKSNDSIQSMPNFKLEDQDNGIVNGFLFAKSAIDELVPNEELDAFKNYFQHNVHIIHYQVPKDIDLNHYFEIMNSRGEQLEKHEIIKARLIEKLNQVDKAKFSRLWDYCSEMNVYIQQKYKDEHIFGPDYVEFKISHFDQLPIANSENGKQSILQMINEKLAANQNKTEKEVDSFQPIMDFSNFLLVVLKVTRMKEVDFSVNDFKLDDKELINEFDKLRNVIDENFVKQFGFNLLKAKYLLDNYLVHHSNEEDTFENNPWKLQTLVKKDKNLSHRNLTDDTEIQIKLLQLLSMFEVSFTARQRKNYLFYCLFYLFNANTKDFAAYLQFVSSLADKYFKDVYLKKENLNEINTPKPGSFDDMILIRNVSTNLLNVNVSVKNNQLNFNSIYGTGIDATKGIPLFVFNYLDYKIWEGYANKLRGNEFKKDSEERKQFFTWLGCNDFELNAFQFFYFSRTRRSLEHYFPQANANGENGNPNKNQINCLGNYAMIGSEANSSGSNWTPRAKLEHYLDGSGKIKQVSVASLKFMVMMQVCKDNQIERERNFEWMFEDIQKHQENMVKILCPQN